MGGRGLANGQKAGKHLGAGGPGAGLRPGAGLTAGSGPGTALRAGGAVAGAAVLGVTLAACGSLHATTATGTARTVPATAPASGPAGASSPASGTPAAGTGSAVLCRDAGTVTGLQVIRVGTRQPQQQITFPDRGTVPGPEQARTVARALCGLPAAPRGVLPCPAMFPGTTYQLVFTDGSRRLPTVTASSTGCETVTGAGPARQASDGFWTVLGTAAGVSRPGRDAFSGVAPGCQPPSQRLRQINGCPGLARPGGAATPGGVARPGGAS